MSSNTSSTTNITIINTASETAPNIFRTTNRFLENFLYFHKVYFVRQVWNDDGSPCWEYNISPRFLEVFNEYKQLYPQHTSSSRLKF